MTGLSRIIIRDVVEKYHFTIIYDCDRKSLCPGKPDWMLLEPFTMSWCAESKDFRYLEMTKIGMISFPVSINL
jgi:hypothetical protein